MTAPGRLIGSGRSADIYAYGDGRVLRRRRSGPIPAAETTVMSAVSAAGYPAPTVYAVNGADMVMDRIDGIDLLTHLTKRPWRARSVGVMLADLHCRLAAVPIEGTDLPTQLGQRESFIHGDLHPGNVLLASEGPIVIDWEGAGVGASDADVATTWMLLEIADADDIPRLLRPFVGLIRKTLLRAFLRGVDPPRVETVAAVCAGRLGDTNLRANELDRIRAFAALHGV